MLDKFPSILPAVELQLFIKAVSMTAVKWDAYDVENTAGNAGRCHPDRQHSSR